MTRHTAKCDRPRVLLAALASLMVLSGLFAFAAENINGGTSESIITVEAHSKMFRRPISAKVYTDGTVVRGTNSHTISTQVIHAICAELDKLGFFEIKEPALHRKLEKIRETGGKSISRGVDGTTTTLNVCYQGRSNEITWYDPVVYSLVFPEIPEFEKLSHCFHIVHTNFFYPLRR